MFVVRPEERFRFSAGEPTGGESPVASPATVDGSADQNAAPSDNDEVGFGDDWLRNLDASVGARLETRRAAEEAAEEVDDPPRERPLPESVTTVAPKAEPAPGEADPAQPVVDKPVDPVVEAPKPEVKAEDPKPEPPKAEPPKPVVPATFDINGQRYSHEDVLAMARYYDKKASEIDSERSELDKMKASADAVILRHLKANPALREKFLKMSQEVDPAVNQEYQKTETELRLERVEQDNETRRKADEERAQAEETRRVNAENQRIYGEIERDCTAEADRLGLPRDFVTDLAYVAGAFIQQGRLPMRQDAITQFIKRGLAGKADWLAKRGAPAVQPPAPPAPPARRVVHPPPPANGTAPRIFPEQPPLGSRELRNLARDDLAKALGEL